MTTAEDSAAAAAHFEALTASIYAVLSAPAAKRDWDGIRDHYHPQATLVRTGIDDEWQTFALTMSLDEYIDNVTELLDGVEFEERELSQSSTVFGNVARIASVYEYRYRRGGEESSGRGVNFFNLVNDGDGWKIINIVWDNEREGLTLEAAGIPVRDEQD